MAQTQVHGTARATAQKLVIGPKVQVSSRALWMDMQMCIEKLEVEKGYREFGIMGFRPPPGHELKTFDLLNEGAAGWRHLQNVPAISTYSEQIRSKAAPHLTVITDKLHRGSYTFAEFTEFSKVKRGFEVYSHNVPEAIDLHWKAMAKTEYVEETPKEKRGRQAALLKVLKKKELERKKRKTQSGKEEENLASDEEDDDELQFTVPLPPPGPMYPYTIQGSIFKAMPPEDRPDGEELQVS